MTANERLAEIKANLSEVYDTWGLGDEILLGSRSEIAGLSDTAGTLIAALKAVLDIDPGEPACAEDIGYYDGIMAVRRAINEALDGKPKAPYGYVLRNGQWKPDISPEQKRAGWN